MTILVDSSVWIDYFRSGRNSASLDNLIDENLIVTNDLILTELVPYLIVRNRRKIVQLLYAIKKIDLTIHWGQLIDWQYLCLKRGHNGVGIPDLIIAQNAAQHRCVLYSLDTHFKLIAPIAKIELFN